MIRDDDGQQNSSGAAMTANEASVASGTMTSDCRPAAPGADDRRRDCPDASRARGAEAGEKVFDVGSGSGRSAIAAAREVGPDGESLGADISESLVAVARRRAA